MFSKIKRVFLLVIVTGSVQAEILWQADFENGTLDNWTYVLHKQGVSISGEHSEQGQLAAKITIKGDADYLWDDKPFLNRVELQHKPLSANAGNDTYMAWSFMFPILLSDSRHEFAYWESDKSYQQIMRFDVAAGRIGFRQSNSPNLIWQHTELKPRTWYQMAMHVHWSEDPAKGFVSIWFNGQQVVKNVPMQTLPNAHENAFIQLGILRDQSPEQETIWLDTVREASSIDALVSPSQ